MKSSSWIKAWNFVLGMGSHIMPPRTKHRFLLLSALKDVGSWSPGAKESEGFPQLRRVDSPLPHQQWSPGDKAKLLKLYKCWVLGEYIQHAIPLLLVLRKLLCVGCLLVLHTPKIPLAHRHGVNEYKHLGGMFFSTLNSIITVYNRWKRLPLRIKILSSNHQSYKRIAYMFLYVSQQNKPANHTKPNCA